MVPPIIKNKKFLYWYIGIWSIVAAIDVTLIYTAYYKDIEIALAEGFVFNFIMAGIGLGLWFPVYYTNIEDANVERIIFHHLVSCCIAVGLWMIISYTILLTIFNITDDYITYLKLSAPWRGLTGLLCYIIIVALYYLIIYYNNFREKQLNEAELKALIKESQLSSLKSQINPHFLFNSLNSISSLTIIKPEKAREMVIELSDFLRYSLSQSKEQLTTLEEEIQNMNRYFDIEKIRFGKRLKVIKNIDLECQKLMIPGLILQPVLENAVKYGIYESIEESKIVVTSRCNEHILEISIKNDYDPDFIANKGEGIGLRNIRNRLRLLYGSDQLIIINKTDKEFEVILRFPQNSRMNRELHQTI